MVAKGRGEIAEPVGIDDDVIIDESENFAAGFTNAGVEGVGFALPGFENIAAMSGEFLDVFFGEFAGSVFGIVVDDEKFPVVARGELRVDNAVESRGEALGAVVGAEDDGDIHA
jgi:hypothetical protein